MSRLSLNWHIESLPLWAVLFAILMEHAYAAMVSAWFVLPAVSKHLPEPPKQETRQHHRSWQLSTHAIARLRTVDHCRPDWFAALVPAIPDDSVLAEVPRGSNFGIGDGFRSILRDMAEKKTDRSACRFTVQQARDGKPFLAVHLYRDTIPVLREVSFGFDLLRGTQVEEAKKLAEMLNEHVLEMFVTTDKAV